MLVFQILFPLAGGQGVRGSYPDTVAVSFCLVEQVVDAIFVDNVSVDTRFLVGRNEQRLGFAFKVGEVGIGIGVIDNVGAVTVFHGPVDHVLSRFGVINGLRGPHTFQFLLAGIALLHVDDRVRPVYQVGRLQQHHGAVGIPSVVRYHVRHYHVERLSVFTTQDVRVAYAAGRADDFGIDDRFVVVQCPVGISVHADGIAYGLLADVVAGEVNEEIGCQVFFFNLLRKGGSQGRQA